MRYIKQILLTFAVLVLLISCFAFSVSATQVDVLPDFEFINFSVELGNITETYTFPSGSTWSNVTGLDLYFGDEQASFAIVDDYVVLRINSRDAGSRDYRLSYKNTNLNKYCFVVSNDELADHTTYSLLGYLTLYVEDNTYLFEVPSWCPDWNRIVYSDYKLLNDTSDVCRFDLTSSREVILKVTADDGREAVGFRISATYKDSVEPFSKFDAWKLEGKFDVDIYTLPTD